MAITINRTLRDGASTAAFEVVATGDALGDTDTIIDVSALSGASGDADERVRVKRIKAFVAGVENTAAAPDVETRVDLIWAGSGDVFMTLPVGSTDMQILCSPTAGSTGDITFQSTANTSFTLHLFVEKTYGFFLSTAKLSPTP